MTCARPLLFFIVAVVLLSTSWTTASAAEKKVLFMYGDRSNGVIMAYREVLQSAMRVGSPDRITFYEEYMDLVLYPGEDYISLLRGFYRQKYKDQRFDLIVAQSPSPLSFLSLYGEELFPGTPIVFGTLDQSRIEGLSLGTKVTGVLADFPFGKSLDTALMLQPDVRTVVVVSGTSPIDMRYLAKARTEFSRFEGRVEFTYLTDLPLEEVEQKLANLPDHTITFFVTLYRDGAGQTFSQMDSAARVAKASRVPTYSVVDRFIEVGVIGGCVFSLEADANEVAKIALRVLGGEKPSDIPIRIGDTNRYMFNWPQLQRWHIDEGRLPQGSILRFQQLSFWAQYKWRIVAVSLLCLLEAALIVWLLINRKSRRRAEEKTERFAARVEAQHKRLKEVVNNVPGIVWESRLGTDSETREAQFVSPYVENMLGYGVDEWLSSDFVSSIVHEEDRANVSREIAEIIETGEGRVIRFRCRAKDGRLPWVEAHMSPMRDDAGKIVGLRGVTLDISERKRDEQALQKLTGRLLLLQDEERRRVAGELHDGLGQNLAIIKNRALIGLRDQTNQDRIREQLHEIAATATASILEVREIAHNLRPYELDRLGLVAAIESMIDRVSDSTTITLSSDLESIEGLLSPEAETSVYRIVQEGVNNLVKHSRASAARIEIKRSAEHLLISVQDNGNGIPSSNSPENGNNANGFGLAGIAERVRVLGGSMTVNSQPLEGTTLTIKLDLSNGTRE